jgi:hypothetical protein
LCAPWDSVSAKQDYPSQHLNVVNGSIDFLCVPLFVLGGIMVI